MPTAVKRIVITGPESTGKSTLAAGLARHYGTLFVPEFAREYLQELGRAYQYEDLLEIARGQIRLEEQAEKKAKRFLFCDTDLTVLLIWSSHKYGRCDPWILEQLARRKYDYSFLTAVDFPWVEDPLREHPQPEMRRSFFERYRMLLQELGRPFSVVSGPEESRLRAAINILDQMGGTAATGKLRMF